MKKNGVNLATCKGLKPITCISPHSFDQLPRARDFESILNTTGLTMISDKDADFKGNFRLIRMAKE